MNLTITDLNYSYGNFHAIKDLSLDLSPGIYGLVGANGAGKTTLIKLLTGILKPDSGIIFLDGESILRKEYRSILGLMPQSQKGYDNLTGYQLLWYMASMKNIKKEDAKENIQELITMASMEAFIHNKIKSYSGGMRQRLMLSQALLGDPKIIFLDEPTAGLDPKERINIRNYISAFSKNRIIIIATHVMQDIESISKEIILMNEGSVTYAGTVPDILESISPYVYESKIAHTDLAEYQKKYKISNIIQKNDALTIKYLNTEEALENAKHTQASLDDVYLHYLV